MLDKTNWEKIEVVPDLTKPTLEGLAYLLRHPELWPAEFEWDWDYCATCAMGLVLSYWPQVDIPRLELHTGTMARLFNINATMASLCFLSMDPLHKAIGYGAKGVPTPEHIALYIEDYLKDQARTS